LVWLGLAGAWWLVSTGFSGSFVSDDMGGRLGSFLIVLGDVDFSSLLLI
jgi:hypothetical protein